MTNTAIGIQGGFLRRARLLRQEIGLVEISQGTGQFPRIQTVILLRSAPQRQLNQPVPSISNHAIVWHSSCLFNTSKGGGSVELNMESKLVHMPNPHALPEHSEAGILSHNLLQMRSSLMHVLMDESVGGNAGTIEIGGKPFSCAAVRGFADADSGKIIAFGNYQDVPENIRSRYPQFVLRIALGFGHGIPLLRIIECSSAGSFSPQAKAMLDKTKEHWNSSFAAGRRAA